jgi:hypothetical protein
LSAAERLRQNWAAHAAAVGLSPAQVTALLTLVPGEAVPMRSLAARLNYDRAADARAGGGEGLAEGGGEPRPRAGAERQHRALTVVRVAYGHAVGAGHFNALTALRT